MNRSRKNDSRKLNANRVASIVRGHSVPARVKDNVVYADVLGRPVRVPDTQAGLRSFLGYGSY